MSRADRTIEDKENYAMFTAKMQKFGENLYQQLQSQQFTQQQQQVSWEILSVSN